MQVIPFRRPESRPALAGLKPHHHKAIRALAQWKGRADPLPWLFELGKGRVFALLLEWRDAMATGGLSPSCIHGRLSALCSILHLARQQELVDWEISLADLRPPKVQVLRDTSGPGGLKVRAWIAREPDPRKKLAFALMGVLTLRRHEVATLRWQDVVRGASPALYVLRKGKGGVRERVPLPDRILSLLDALPQGQPEEPLLGVGVQGLYYWTRGLEPGMRPHKLRHSAITEALNRTNGNLRAVGALAGHADLRMMRIYDDNRLEAAREAADAVAEAVLGEREEE